MRGRAHEARRGAAPVRGPGVHQALGTGFAGFGPGEIEITPDIAGRPQCALYEGALARAKALAGPGRFRIWVSVTHDKGMAAATAIIEGEGQSTP